MHNPPPELIFIICRFLVREFACLLISPWNPQLVPMALWQVFTDTGRVVKCLIHPVLTFPVERSSVSLFQLLSSKQEFFLWSISAMF